MTKSWSIIQHTFYSKSIIRRYDNPFTSIIKLSYEYLQYIKVTQQFLHEYNLQLLSSKACKKINLWTCRLLSRGNFFHWSSLRKLTFDWTNLWQQTMNSFCELSGSLRSSYSLKENNQKVSNEQIGFRWIWTPSTFLYQIYFSFDSFMRWNVVMFYVFSKILV